VKRTQPFCTLTH